MSKCCGGDAGAAGPSETVEPPSTHPHLASALEVLKQIKWDMPRQPFLPHQSAPVVAPLCLSLLGLLECHVTDGTHSSGVQGKVQADLGSGDHRFLTCKPPSCHVFRWPFLGVQWRGTDSSVSSCKGTNPILGASPS